MWPFSPSGFTLIRKDGTTHNRIWAKGVPADTLVVVQDGRYFVAARERDSDNFAVYREGYSTFTYDSQGE